MGFKLLPSTWLGSEALISEPYFTAVGGGAAGRRHYADGITLGKPGSCPEVPVLLIGLYDNSGSVTGGNDPIGQRFLETYVAISRVGARCRCGKDLVATLHFDAPTSGDLAPTPITRAHREEIAKSLAVPPDGAGISMLGPSLVAAQKLATEHDEHRTVLVALTDFELFDNFLDHLIAFPGDVHAVALRAVPPSKLVDAPGVEVTHVDYGSAPGAVARAVFSALTSTRPGAAKTILPDPVL